MVKLTPLDHFQRQRLQKLLDASDREDAAAQPEAAERERKAAADKERKATAQAAKLKDLRTALAETVSDLNSFIDARIGSSGRDYDDFRGARKRLPKLCAAYEAAFASKDFVSRLDEMSCEGLSRSFRWTLQHEFPAVFRHRTPVRSTASETEKYEAAVDAQLSEQEIAWQREKTAKAIVAAGKARRSEKLSSEEVLLLADLREKEEEK